MPCFGNGICDECNKCVCFEEVSRDVCLIINFHTPQESCKNCHLHMLLCKINKSHSAK